MRITMIVAALALAVAAPAVSHAQTPDSRPAVQQHVRNIRPRHRKHPRARMHQRHRIRNRRFGRRGRRGRRQI